jgi:hypothetical protein
LFALKSIRRPRQARETLTSGAVAWVSFTGGHDTLLTSLNQQRHQEMMPGRARPAADAAARSPPSQRASVVGLPVAGLAEPLRVNIDFETGVGDQFIEWLTVVRALQPANNPTSCDARSNPMEVYVCVTGSPTRHARPSRTTMARKSPEAGAGPTHHHGSRTRRGLKRTVLLSTTDCSRLKTW